MHQPRLRAVVTLLPAPRATFEDQVFAALLGLGGAAHVDDIIERVSLERRQRGLLGGPPVRMIVESALHHMRTPDDLADGEGGACVYRPFGAGSRRWAVCRNHAADAARPPAVRRPKLALLSR